MFPRLKTHSEPMHSGPAPKPITQPSSPPLAQHWGTEGLRAWRKQSCCSPTVLKAFFVQKHCVILSVLPSVYWSIPDTSSLSIALVLTPLYIKHQINFLMYLSYLYIPPAPRNNSLRPSGCSMNCHELQT